MPRHEKITAASSCYQSRVWAAFGRATTRRAEDETRPFLFIHPRF